MPRYFSQLKEQSPLARIVAIAIIFFSVTLAFSLHRYYSFYASYDQGIFNQVFWNSLHGRFFQSSLSAAVSSSVIHDGQIPTVFYHRLGQHFTPALLLWLPFYALYPNPATLVVLQVTIITAGGLVLYALARQYLPPAIAVTIAASFYGANAVIGPTFSNFHDLCQLPLFIFGLLLALEKRIWWLFWLLVLFTLAVREDTGVILFGIGAYLTLSRRHINVGLVLCVVSFSYVVLATNVLMPMFSEDVSRRFMLERFGQYVEGDEASSLEILWAMLRNPINLLQELFSPLKKTINYLLGQWLPLMFVPSISGATWTMTAFPLFQLFSQKGTYSLSVNIRYAITVVPSLFYGAIIWWSGHRAKFTPRLQRFWAFCIALSIFFSFTSSPHHVFYFLIPDSIQPWVYVSLPKQWNRVEQFQKILAKIPPDASVSATTYIIPHLSNRREIIRLPAIQLRNDRGKVVEVDYAIADIWRLEKHQIIYKNDRVRLRQLIPVLESLITQNKYGIIDLQDGIIFLQKGVSSNPQALANWYNLRNELQPILENT